MIYENDYILRQIQLFAQYIARTVFNKDTVWYSHTVLEEIPETELLHKKLLELISKKEFCKAEDMLFSEFRPESKAHMAVALDFYSRLAEIDDSVLEANGFSKEEVMSGLKEISDMSFFGVDIDIDGM